MRAFYCSRLTAAVGIKTAVATVISIAAGMGNRYLRYVNVYDIRDIKKNGVECRLRNNSSQIYWP